MRVAVATFLFDHGPGGGAAAVARWLVDALLGEGEKVTVLTTHRDGHPQVERKGPLEIVRLPPRNLYWIGEKDSQPSWKRVLWQLREIANPGLARLVERSLATSSPDLLHAHKLRGLSSGLWTAAHRAGVRRIVQTCHDYELMSPQGALEGRVGRAAAEGKFPLSAYAARRATSSRRVRIATAPCRYTLDRLLEAGLFPNARTEVIPNTHGDSAADVRRRRDAGRGPRRPGPVRILFLGRLEPNKGIGRLCEIASEVPELEVDVAGDGSLATSLRERWSEVERFRFHGHVDETVRTHLLRDADVLAVPSSYPEIAPLVVAEAHARGVPVLATRVGGLPEAVSDGNTGWLVPDGDNEALRHRLERLADNPERPAALAEPCFRRAEEISADAVLARYRDVYRRVTEPR